MNAELLREASPASSAKTPEEVVKEQVNISNALVNAAEVTEQNEKRYVELYRLDSKMARMGEDRSRHRTRQLTARERLVGSITRGHNQLDGLRVLPNRKLRFKI